MPNSFNPQHTHPGTARTYFGVGIRGYVARRFREPENGAVEPKDEIMGGWSAIRKLAACFRVARDWSAIPARSLDVESVLPMGIET